MRKNDGFIMIGSLLTMFVCTVLLLSAITAITSCLRMEERSVQVEELLGQCQLALAGKDASPSVAFQERLLEETGMNIVEVQARDERNPQLVCNLLWVR